MPTVIDHAIAIPTRQPVIWEIIRDIAQNPNWQLDSQRVQFLSTSKAGRGTRWRNTTARGKEQVIEILAWYEGLGYEYRIVDGANFENSRGRIRLQEAPEGTIVQWTFSYDVKGFFGNLQNNLGAKRQVDNEVVQGLRKLYGIIKDAKADERIVPEESKAYLKEAPDVEERAKYQPRHPSAVKAQELTAIPDADAPYKPPKRSTASVPLIPEPPIAEDDTHPNALVQPEALKPLVPDAPKPIVPEVAKPQPSLNEPDFLRHMPEQMPISFTPPAPISPVAPKAEEETVAAPPPILSETEAVKAAPQATVEPLNPVRDYSKLDTAQVSVFELFGLPKPSETEKVRAINDEPAPSVTIFEPKPVEPQPSLDIPSPTPAVIPLPDIVTSESIPASSIFNDITPIIPDVEPEPKRRTGLRANLRQRLAPVRLPKVES